MCKSVKLKDDYHQVCIWPGTIIENENTEKIKEFEAFVESRVGVKVQFLETILTKPDTDEDGFEVQDTGKRHDIFFAVHKNDVMKFALPKLEMGARWIEDVLAKGNYRCPIYPDHVYNYVSWLVEDIDFPKGACCEL